MSKARVSATQVKEIVNTTLDDSVLQASMIDTANLFVDTHLADSGHSADMLAKIELYLAAHFVAISTQGGTIKFTKLGDASESYDTDALGTGLSSTIYGQTALALDTTGTLAAIGTGTLRAEFRVI